MDDSLDKSLGSGDHEDGDVGKKDDDDLVDDDDLEVEDDLEDDEEDDEESYEDLLPENREPKFEYPTEEQWGAAIASYKDPVAALLDIEEPGEPPLDYLKIAGLTQADIPELIRLAADRHVAFSEDPKLPDAMYGPVHAWRALGQFREVAAIEPLLDAMGDLDRSEDDWYLDEYPPVFARIGAQAIPALSRYVLDEQKRSMPRVVAGNCLVKIGLAYPETRTQCVDTITRAMEFADVHASDLISCLVCSLLDLKASESLPQIGTVFANGSVDESLVDWRMVQHALGTDDPDPTPERPRYFEGRDASDDMGGSANMRSKKKKKQAKKKLQKKQRGVGKKKKKKKK